MLLKLLPYGCQCHRWQGPCHHPQAFIEVSHLLCAAHLPVCHQHSVHNVHDMLCPNGPRSGCLARHLSPALFSPSVLLTVRCVFPAMAWRTATPAWAGVNAAHSLGLRVIPSDSILECRREPRPEEGKKATHCSTVFIGLDRERAWV